MTSRARILEKNGPAFAGDRCDRRVTCIARILKFDVRSKKTCDFRITSRAAVPEEHETAREGICTTCNARIDCRVTSGARVKEGYRTCTECVESAVPAVLEFVNSSCGKETLNVGELAGLATWMPTPVIAIVAPSGGAGGLESANI